VEQRIMIAGFGGQGVLLMGQLIAQGAMDEGKFVSWLPSYGPEMRGGTANCSVVVADEPVGSPVVTEPDVAIIMNKPSLISFEKSVKPGGVLLYNTSLIDQAPTRDDIRVIGVPCNDIAAELGNARVANMVMLGAYCKAAGHIALESIEDAMRHKLGERKAHLMPLNRQALDRGVECAR
jgi:2-oxoglutarate ferredoxin oxidoreductase subunit gamma